MAEKEKKTQQTLLDAQPLSTMPPISEVAKAGEAFNKAMYELGLDLIEAYKAGRCRDSNKMLEAIIEIFKAQSFAPPPQF